MESAARITLKAGLCVLALTALLFLTLWLAYQPLGPWKLPIGVGIAVAKASIVILIFMEQLKAGIASRFAAAAGLLFFLLMIALTFADEGVREHIPAGFGAAEIRDLLEPR